LFGLRVREEAPGESVLDLNNEHSP